MTRLSGAKGKATSRTSNAADVGLNVTATVLKTLQAVAGASPVPGLAQAANLALEITTMVQTAKGNKAGFDGLADDSRELVYVIFCANRNVEKAEDVPPGLAEQLDHILSILLDVKAFAEKGSSRNKFSAFIRAGLDSGQIQDYRQKLQQSLGTFGFQTDISLQVMVHKLVAHHGKMLKMLENKNKDKAEPDGQSRGSSPEPNPTPGPGPSAKPASGFDFGGAGGSPNPWAGMKINRTGGDVEVNHVYSVTNNSDSNNTYTNSTVNKNNTSTVNSNYNRGGDNVTNDYSVKMGENVNFSGASGINFGSNNVNNMGLSS